MNKVVRQILAAQQADGRDKIAAQREERYRRDGPPPTDPEEMVAAARIAREALADARKNAAKRAAVARAYPTRITELQLDDSKLLKLVGGEQQFAKCYRLPYKLQRAAGMRWQRIGDDMKLKPHLVTVAYEISGRRLRPGVWAVEIPEAVYNKVITWLLFTCGPTSTYKHFEAAPKNKGRATNKQQGRWGNPPLRIDGKGGR